MTFSYPVSAPVRLVLIILLLAAATASAQESPSQGKDSVIRSIPLKVKGTADSLATIAGNKFRNTRDTLHKLPDTLIRGSLQWLEEQKKTVKEKYRSVANQLITTPAGLKMKKRDFMNDLSNQTYANLFNTRPLLTFGGGYISYQFDYRSNIDTPYVEKDLAQHNTTGHLNFLIGNILPLRVTFWSRQSNSRLFRDITSVNVSFDAGAFRNQLQAAMKERLLKLAPHLKDSLTEKMYGLKQFQLKDLDALLRTRFSSQALTEANQILKVPGITWQSGLPDSTNRRLEDSAKQFAAEFLELYRKTIETFKIVQEQTDSLRKVYETNLKRIEDYKQFIDGKPDQSFNSSRWRDRLAAYGLEDMDVPAKYKWLMGLRNFSLGRSTVNTSELTAKNISVNGIHVEYNSWYYLGITAGLIDYRFRDFAVNGFSRKPQFLYMMRAGLGRLENNYFIAGLYHGKKQLFANSNLAGIPVTGLSLEAKWQIAPSTFLIGEIAKSISPDYGSDTPGKNTRLSLSDKSNQAVSLKLQSYLPFSQTRVEALYKKTGANFQSFSSFQANAEIESWSIKMEQPFFKRMLRLSGSLRKNEFSNPYIEQDYKSNTVFKSLTASFRKNRWPVITVGYQPMSQLTVFAGRIMENQFQTFTSTVLHTYRLGKLNTISTVMFNKFFNNQKDSGYIYYNSTNIYWTQQFMFSRFTANIGASYSKNGTYQLTVLEEGFQIPAGRVFSTIGFGTRINVLNSEQVKAGAFINTHIRIFKQDNITLSYERGFLPGFNQGLVRNEMAGVQFVKNF